MINYSLKVGNVPNLVLFMLSDHMVILLNKPSLVYVIRSYVTLAEVGNYSGIDSTTLKSRSFDSKTKRKFGNGVVKIIIYKLKTVDLQFYVLKCRMRVI